MLAPPQYELDASAQAQLDAGLAAFGAARDAWARMDDALACVAQWQALACATEPPPTPDATRRALWRALALGDLGALTARHASADGAAQARLGELAALAAFRTALWTPASGQSCSELWRGDADVTEDRRPVRAYSASDALSALRVLRNDMTECTLDAGLYPYCVALERRFGELLFYALPGAVHDALAYRVAVPGRADLYRANQALLDVAWACFRGLYRRLLDAGPMLGTAAPPPPDDAERAALGRLWALLQRSAGTMGADEVSTLLKQYYVEQQLRPGDRELYRLAHLGITPNAEGIMQAVSEPARMAAAMDATTLTIGQAFERHGAALAPGAPEPQALSLAMFDLLCACTGTSAYGFGADLGFVEHQMRADPDRPARLSHGRPLLVQLFNHWQLLVRGQVRRYDSLLRALYHWLGEVRSTHDARGDAAADDIDMVAAVMLDRGFYAQLMAAAFGEPEAPPVVADQPRAPRPAMIEFE